MTSGTIHFTTSIDDTPCPDTSGVGIDAVGGVFNCGLPSTNFYIYCDPACEPRFAVQEIRIWTDQIVSHLGTPYMFEGNVELEEYQSDMDKVFKTGTYPGTAGDYGWNNLYAHNKGTATFAGLCLKFESMTTITNIITILRSGSHVDFALAAYTDTITADTANDVNIRDWGTHE